VLNPGKLRERGQILLEKFIQEELPRLGDIKAVEKVFQLNVSTLTLPFIGVIDLVADLDEEITVVDFKTSASAYGEYEVTLSDRLTAYQLAEPNAAQSALCVLVKSKEPRTEWHKAHRTGQQLIEYLNKTQLIVREIDAGHFYKRPGKWCSWCDYLPVCVGNTQQVKETLVQVRSLFISPASLNSAAFSSYSSTLASSKARTEHSYSQPVTIKSCTFRNSLLPEILPLWNMIWTSTSEL
jgi:hypothetical protein